MTDKGEMSKKKTWIIILASLADDFAILVLVGLGLWYFKVRLPLWAFITIGLAIATFAFIRTWAVLPSLRRKKITGAEGMIGQVGEVVESLKPSGTVKIGAEYWQAESLDGDAEVDEEVEIVGINRLKLEVRRKVS